jgi:recombination protein RecR
LGLSISTLPTTIGSYSTCGNITNAGALCGICSDNKRNDNTIAVVASVQHVIAFEKSGAYRGLYHVLREMVNPLEGVNGDDIRGDLDALAMRLRAGMELIVALPSSSEGEATAMVIAKAFDGAGVVVTRIARGVQANGDIGEADAVTINRAVGERQKMDG